MKINTIDINGKKKSLDISEKIFSADINEKLITNVLYSQIANYKPRLAKTKQKNEIKGSTAKIYAQKGTGNARHASRKAPIFVGGGVAHGPKGGGNYKIRKLNKKQKRKSLISLLSKKNKENQLLVIKDFQSKITKTKEFYKIIKKFDILNSLLVLDKNSKSNIELSSRNIPNIKVTLVEYLNIFDLLKFKKIIFTISSIKKLEEKYSND